MLRDDILKAIITADGPLTTPETIAHTIQCPFDVVRDCLADLDLEGLVSIWDCEDTVSVTLTPLAAERLGVHIVDNGYDAFGWDLVGNPQPRLVSRDKNVSLGDFNNYHNKDVTYSDVIIAPDEPPDIIAESAEHIGVLSAISRRHRSTFQRHAKGLGVKYDQHSLPYPTVLLGIGSALWDNVKHKICPGCNNRELKPHEYCLRCDRWGMDQLAKTPVVTKLKAYVEKQAKEVDIRGRQRDKIKKRLNTKAGCNKSSAQEK